MGDAGGLASLLFSASAARGSLARCWQGLAGTSQLLHASKLSLAGIADGRALAAR